MKKLALLIALYALAPLWGAQSASAASAYDDHYQTVDSVHLTNSQTYGGGPCTVELGVDWLKPMREGPRYNPEAYDSITDAIQNGGNWAVSQTLYENSDHQVIVWWTNDDSLNLQWEAGGISVGGNNLKKATLFLMNAGGYIDCNSPSIYNYQTINYREFISTPDGVIKNLLVASDNINYPVDYEGKDIVSTVIPKTKKMPNASIHVRDIDIMLAFDPNNGVGNIRASLQAPNDDYVFKDKVFSDYESWATQVEVDQYGIYTLTADYFVPIPYIIPENIEPVTLEIEININGDQFSIGTSKLCNVETGVCESANEMKPCITTVPPGGALNGDDKVAPYLNIPNCIDNFFTMQHMLAFKTVKFGQAFTNPNECHKLGTIGNWLKLENKTVCAKFPAEMRNIITPFVVFALALTVLAGITRYRGNA